MPKYRTSGFSTRKRSMFSGDTPWYIEDAARFDLIDTKGYNPHARIAWGQNPWDRVPELMTTLEDVGYATHSHIHTEEFEEELESFYGVTLIRPTVKKAYLGYEPDPWDGWDPERMFVELEGSLPPEESKPEPEPEPLKTIRCSNCHELGHNVKTCGAPWHRRPRKPRKPKKKTGRPRKHARCSKCNKTGHTARTCGTRKVNTCSMCGNTGHNARTCEYNPGRTAQPKV